FNAGLLADLGLPCAGGNRMTREQLVELRPTLVYDGHLWDEFEGWDHERVFTLGNGDEWEQAEGRYSYRYAYRPRARIWHCAQGHFLDVDCMPDVIRVRRN